MGTGFFCRQAKTPMWYVLAKAKTLTWQVLALAKTPTGQVGTGTRSSAGLLGWFMVLAALGQMLRQLSPDPLLSPE